MDIMVTLKKNLKISCTSNDQINYQLTVRYMPYHSRKSGKRDILFSDYYYYASHSMREFSIQSILQTWKLIVGLFCCHYKLDSISHITTLHKHLVLSTLCLQGDFLPWEAYITSKYLHMIV